MYISSRSGLSSSLDIHLRVRYVEQLHAHVPSFWHVIKLAWVQYLSVLVVLMYVSDVVKKWVFQNQAVQTRAYVHPLQLQKLKWLCRLNNPSKTYAIDRMIVGQWEGIIFTWVLNYSHTSRVVTSSDSDSFTTERMNQSQPWL